jgi:hypothetical protein
MNSQSFDTNNYISNNNLNLPIISIETVDFFAEEGENVAILKIIRSSALDTPLSINFNFSGTADSSDFIELPSNLNLLTGQNEALIIINPKNDLVDEGTEIFTIDIATSSDYEIQNQSASIYVRDKGFIENGVIAPLDETFKLHSLPGAKHTIYLNFNGGNYYHGHDGLNPVYVTPFDMDNNSGLSDEELRTIQQIWKAVSEDYKPFKVNVTTELPEEGNLKKTSESDDKWGVSLLIGDDPGYGFAWSGTEFSTEYDYPGYASINKSDGTYWDVSTIGQTCSHEVGHTMGLNHHGGPGEYHNGGDVGGFRWVPIMGKSWAGLNQWNNGSYSGATNPNQDDLAIISNEQNGFRYRSDDHPNEQAFASPMIRLDDGYNSLFIEGIIERNTDIDWFSFDHEGGDLILSIFPETENPNLDIGSKLYNSNLELISSSDLHANLSALYSINLPQGKYYLTIEGVGSNEGVGYSDYGSLGKYSIISGSGSIAEYNPDGELASSQISGSTDFSSLTITDLSSFNLGSAYFDGSWALYSSSSSPQYISFSITSGPNQQVVFEQLQASFYSFSVSTLSLRSSQDNFTSDIDTQLLESNKHQYINFNIQSMTSTNETVEFRIYFSQNSGYQYLTGSNYTYSEGRGLKLTGRVVNLTNLNINKVSTNVLLYPNPTYSVINIVEDFTIAKVFDLQERKLLESNSKAINLSELPNSIYLLRLYDNSNNVLSTSKVIKK